MDCGHSQLPLEQTAFLAAWSVKHLGNNLFFTRFVPHRFTDVVLAYFAHPFDKRCQITFDLHLLLTQLSDLLNFSFKTGLNEIDATLWPSSKFSWVASYSTTWEYSFFPTKKRSFFICSSKANFNAYIYDAWYSWNTSWVQDLKSVIVIESIWIWFPVHLACAHASATSL